MQLTKLFAWVKSLYVLLFISKPSESSAWTPIAKVVVEYTTGIILEKLFPEIVTLAVFVPSDIADPNTLLIVLLVISIFVGGLTGVVLPQHKIPYERGDEFPPPGNNMPEITLLEIVTLEAPGLTVIPLPVEPSPVIDNPSITTLLTSSKIEIPVTNPDTSKITLGLANNEMDLSMVKDSA